MRNKVFIATSFDGFIADQHGDIGWLTDMSTPSTGDGGFSKFMESVDAVVMGRKTYEKVLSFGIDWPYSKKVFVWTNTLDEIPINLREKVEFIRGGFQDIIRVIQQRQFSSLYIDGGQTIQTFLRERSLHEIIVTQAPILLGRGIPFFANSPRVRLRHQSTEVFDNGMVQSHYVVEV